MNVIELCSERQGEKESKENEAEQSKTVALALDVYYRSSHEYKEFNSHNQKQMPN